MRASKVRSHGTPAGASPIDSGLRPTAHDVKRGTVIGLTFGVAYTVIAALIFGIRGNAPFAANGTNVGALMLLYIVGCSASGFVVGLLIRVARRSSVLGGVVGIIAIAPFCFAAIALTDYQRGRWNSDDTIAAVIMSVAFGIAGAHLFRKKPIVW